MKIRKLRYGACYYCICTACTRFNCPFRHKLYRECYACRERGFNRPRLDCDFFCHYLKKRHFRFKREVAPLPVHFGTYYLNVDGDIFVGKYANILKLSHQLGGTPHKLNIIDYNFNLERE